MEQTETKNQTQRERMMLDDPLPRVISRMAVPSIISFLITSIYNLADTFFVSSLGTNATAAVSVNASLDQIIMMAGTMLAVGAASYISRLLGAKDPLKANRVLSTAFFLAVLFGTVVMVLGVMFIQPMVCLLGATDTCEQYSIQYATYVLLVAPFMAANFVMNHCLRSEGNTLLAMFGMGFGGVLNCILDPIFIFYLNMGVTGASIATAISKLVSFAILIFPYLTQRTTLRISIHSFCFQRNIVGEIFAVGSSSFFRAGLGVVSGIVLNNLAGSISDSLMAGIGVSTKIMMFPFGVVLGFGTGFQPVAGFNWGAKRYDRVIDAYRFASRTAIAGTILMGVALALFANPLIGLFAKADASMAEMGALCIRLQSLTLPIHGWVAVVNMLCAGLGDAKSALTLSTARQGTCFLPIVYPMAWLWGGYGVASVQAVADVLSLFLALPLIHKVQKRIRTVAAEQGG